MVAYDMENSVDFGTSHDNENDDKKQEKNILNHPIKIG